MVAHLTGEAQKALGLELISQPRPMRRGPRIITKSRIISCTVGQRPAPVTILLANSSAAAYKAPAPFAGVVHDGPMSKQLPGQDGIGRNPWVSA